MYQYVQQWNDFFPDFLLQMWGTLQKYKDDDEEDISSFYYSDFEFPVELSGTEPRG